MTLLTSGTSLLRAESARVRIKMVVRLDQRTGRLIRVAVRESMPPRMEAGAVPEPPAKKIAPVQDAAAPTEGAPPNDLARVAAVPIANALEVTNAPSPAGAVSPLTEPAPALSPKELKAAARDAADLNMQALIEAIAAKNDVELPLVHSVIRAESNYNPAAVSRKGAIGLMQLIPDTAHRFGSADAFDARQNVEAGVRYLHYLLQLYKNDYTKVIAAYNAGEGAVARYGGVPPYKETRDYVAIVARNLKIAREYYEKRAKQAKTAKERDEAQEAVAEIKETYNPIRASVTADGRVFYRTP